jgi:hypothetical protein
MRHIALITAVALIFGGCVTEPAETPTDDDDATLSWDPTPPEAPDGATFVAVLSCGLFAGPIDRTWIKTGDVWEEPAPGPEGPSLPIAEVQPCMQQGAKQLSWLDSGAIQFEAATWSHALQPSPTEDVWLGEGSPIGDPSDECLDGLAAAGLSLPVRFSLSLSEIRYP